MAYFHSPFLFLTAPSATRTTDKAKAWHIIKMLRGNFIWTHKPEHLLRKAGARINTLGQIGSLSKSLISHAVEQPFSCRSTEGVCHTSWKCSLPRTGYFFYLHCTKLKIGQIWIQDKLRYVSNCSHSLTLTFQRAVLLLHCPALLPCCSATKMMRIRDCYGWKYAMACSLRLGSCWTQREQQVIWYADGFSFHRTILEALIISMLICTMKRSHFQPMDLPATHVRE